MNKKRFIGIDISIGSYNDFIEEIAYLGLIKQSSYVCIANVHMLVEAYKDSSFSNIVNNADIVTPDGMPLVKGGSSLYGINQKRVAGMDLLPDLLATSQEKNISVFFYGGTEEMLDGATKYIEQNYNHLQIAGMYSPPFRSLRPDEEEDVINKINSAEAGIVFVVLGCPKQERWMASMKNKINACMVGVGGALPVMIGMQKRAPVWMQKNSLEWLYRLYQEPKRLIKRYTVTNTIFVLLYCKEMFKKNI